MKANIAKSKYLSFRYYKKESSLFGRLFLVLEADLSEPAVEATARALLQVLRERGYDFFSGDLEDPDCLACLHMSLLCAADMALDIEKLKAEGITEQHLAH